jgi:hypothetical protein
VLRAISAKVCALLLISAVFAAVLPGRAVAAATNKNDCCMEMATDNGCHGCMTDPSQPPKCCSFNVAFASRSFSVGANPFQRVCIFQTIDCRSSGEAFIQSRSTACAASSFSDRLRIRLRPVGEESLNFNRRKL